ncbi:MAG TPA: tetratricopeptide repeat protein [Gemmatimonadales bacterium]|nr:tetratricopeptide repeat protein [Gemmatimonadales bacterium]
MADEVKRLTAELARNPGSLVFLALGETLRARGQLDAAARIALTGLERHPHLADAHDLYARVLADAGDVEQARDEWGMALRFDPKHIGALKGLGFVHFHAGDFDQALEHLETALAADPLDQTVVQALQTVRAAAEIAEAEAAAAAAETEDAVEGIADVFAGLEGARQGLLLVDLRGRLLGGGMRDGTDRDVAEPVAAYLAGASQEAERTARLLELGTWSWIVAEGTEGSMHVSQPSDATLLLVRRDRSVPSGRLAVFAEHATAVARAWLEEQQG